MPINLHTLIDTLVPEDFQCKNDCLKEPQEHMSVNIDGTGVVYSLCTFDRKLDKKYYPKGLYPFFNKIPGAHSVCDYTLFATFGSKVFVLLIELKKGDKNANPQLNAGECMARFVIDTINRLNKTDFNPQYRHISIRKPNIVRKGRTKVQPIKYIDNKTEFKGRCFCLKEFLH